MSVLIAVAISDDKALGAGGAAYQLSQQSHEMNSCILSGSIDPSTSHPKAAEFKKAIEKAQKTLGISNVFFADLPNIAFNSVPHLKIVQIIESQIQKYGSDIIFTPYLSDLNNNQTHARMAVSHFYQRRDDIPSLKELYMIEIHLSTDWAYPNYSSDYQPNGYLKLNQATLDAKIASVVAYQDIKHDYATYGGVQADVIYAETFQQIYTRFSTLKKGRLNVFKAYKTIN